MDRDRVFRTRDRHDPAHWERDLVVAVLVRAVKDCLFLDSSHPEAYSAYHFLMDDAPWDLIWVSHNCRETVRGILPDPAESPAYRGVIAERAGEAVYATVVQDSMDIFRDP